MLNKRELVKHLNQLLEKLKNKSCAKQELKELHQLLEDDKLVSRYFKNEYKKVDKNSEIDDAISKSIWQGISKEIGKTKPLSFNKKRKTNIKQFVGIAASIALLITIGSFYWYSQKSKQWILVQNTSKEVKEIILPDSSHVWLSSQSSLSYAPTFNTLKRQTELTGQAFFEVTKNPNKPFTIKTGEVLTKVLGTSFNIKSKDSLVEVIVATGLVKVSSLKDFVELTPNQKVLYNTKNKSLQKASTSGQLCKLWFKESIVINRVSLKQLAPILEEKYNVSIVFQDKEAKSATLYSFKLKNKEPLEKIIKRINYMNEVQIKKDANTIRISSK